MSRCCHTTAPAVRLKFSLLVRSADLLSGVVMRSARKIVCVTVMAGYSFGCDDDTKLSVSFQPDFSPVTFIWTDGEGVPVSAGAGYVTPVGRVSLSVERSLFPQDRQIAVAIYRRKSDTAEYFTINAASGFDVEYHGDGTWSYDGDRKLVVHADTGTITVRPATSVRHERPADSVQRVAAAEGTPEPRYGREIGDIYCGDRTNTMGQTVGVYVGGQHLIVHQGDTVELVGRVAWSEKGLCRVMLIKADWGLGITQTPEFPIRLDVPS